MTEKFVITKNEFSWFIEIPPTATSLLPYADALLQAAKGTSDQLMMLVDDSLNLSDFAHEIGTLEGIEIGPKSEMLETVRLAYEDIARDQQMLASNEYE